MYILVAVSIIYFTFRRDSRRQQLLIPLTVINMHILRSDKTLNNATYIVELYRARLNAVHDLSRIRDVVASRGIKGAQRA